MAELMSQKEIDDLLKGVNQEKTTDEVLDEELGENKISTEKANVYRYEKKKDFRFSKIYRSPFIKEENYLFNPSETEIEKNPHIPVVQSLSYFMKKYNPD